MTPRLYRRAAPDPVGRDAITPCRRDCCWTPWGHSTVRDALAPTNPAACRCHRKEP